MRKAPRGTWSYATLLIILFAIGAIAVREVLMYLGGVLHHNFAMVAAAISFLTLGFMLIAGAFGLWTIQFAAGAESRRRIGQLVGAMDYLKDGILVLDKRGRVSGANPAALSLADGPIPPRTPLKEVFSCLDEENTTALLTAQEPSEVERQCYSGGRQRTLRFRSQPSTGVILVLVSDVTRMHAERVRARHTARLQLVGQLARGVAYDFNNLLCSIAGHASVLPRMEPGSPEMEQSLSAVRTSAERGITLAGHLMAIAEPIQAPQIVRHVSEHIDAAATTLRETVQAGWTVEAEAVPIPPVGLPGLQLEHLILNLGLLAADARTDPGVLRITLSRTEGVLPEASLESYAGVLFVGTSPAGENVVDNETLTDSNSETGIMESVIRSVLEEAGGALDTYATADGTPLYRACLPSALTAGNEGDDEGMLLDLSPYVEGWSVLGAWAANSHPKLVHQLTNITKLARAESVADAFSRIEDGNIIDILIVDQVLFGDNMKGLLKAVIKLRPEVGVVVLCESPEHASVGMNDQAIFLPYSRTGSRILTAMIEAKSLSISRNSAS